MVFLFFILMTPDVLTGKVLRSDVSHKSVPITHITVCPEEYQEFFPERVVENVRMRVLGSHVLGGERIRVEYVVDAHGDCLVQYLRFLMMKVKLLIQRI